MVPPACTARSVCARCSNGRAYVLALPCYGERARHHYRALDKLRSGWNAGMTPLSWVRSLAPKAAARRARASSTVSRRARKGAGSNLTMRCDLSETLSTSRSAETFQRALLGKRLPCLACTRTSVRTWRRRCIVIRTRRALRQRPLRYRVCNKEQYR